jgi:outer membrane protein assembly factor BamB
VNALLAPKFAVIPIFVGPLQVLVAMLPAILLGIGSALLALFKPATFKLALKLLWRVKVSLLIAIAVVSGSVLAARAIWRNSTGMLGSAEASKHGWPTFRANAQRTGSVPSDASPLAGGINWTFASEAKTFHSSPTIVGNRIYATSAEVGVFSNRGAIYCLDADTGGVVWKSVPDGFRATFSSPSVSGKYLVTGEGLHQTRDGRILCLDVTRGGAVLWSFSTHSHVESSAAIANGRAYIGAGDDGYYCFQLEPDAQGNPVMVWHLAGEQFPDAESDPVVKDGRVYLGLGMNGNAVVCVEAESGKELWRVATPSPVFTPPTLAHGKLFIGMGQGNFVETEEEVIAATLDRLRKAGKSEEQVAAASKAMQVGGEAWCIDLATQKVDWRFKTDRTVLGAVVAGEDRVFFSSRGGTVYSVGLDGKQLGTWSAHARIIASLALTESHLYAVTENGRLFALERAGLQPAWDASLGSSGSFLSSPGVARGHVYIGSPEDGLLCVGQPASQAAARIWAGHLGGSGVGGNVDGTKLPDHGEVIWQRMEVVAASPAASNGRLFIPLAGSSRNGMLCLRNAHGHDSPPEEWFYQTANGVTSSPAASEKGVVFSDGSKGATGRGLHFVNASSGAMLWSVAVTPNSFGMACLTHDAVLAEDRPGRLTAFDLSGSVRWRNDSILPALAGPVAVVESIIVATTTEALVVMDELEGTTLWRTVPEAAPMTGPVVHRNVIVFGTASGISARSILDGRPLWNAAVGPVKAALALGADFVTAVTSAGELVVLDAQTGEVRAKQAGAIRDIPPLLAGGALLYAAADGLMRYDIVNKTSTRWIKNADLGSLTSPMILSASSVYFATDKPAFIRAGKLDP